MSKLHLIGNAHIDPVWLWRWQEGFSEILSTFRSALDRMKDFPDFKFTSACSSYYEWVEAVDPQMFEEIRQRVKEGRWDVVGGWYLQPDCNIPDGESFVRQALVAQRYFMDKFGVAAKTGYNVDSFGHNGALPKILKGCGMDNYVFMRPSEAEQGRGETVFQWEGDDGSRVCAYRLSSYAMTKTEKICAQKEKAENENTDMMAFYGVGNHGGGPTIALIEAIKALKLDGAVFSTPDAYFQSLDKDNLPTVAGELQHHARGCYSAYSAVKAYNRRCEQNLLAAEKLCLMARELVGAEYPSGELEKAWKNLLFNQFHDILAGCCIKSAYEDAACLYGETMAVTERLINAALQKMAWNIDTLGGNTLPSYKCRPHWKIWQHEVLGTPVTVFNPHTWKVKTLVTVNQNATMVTDAEGRELPFQYVRGEQTNREDMYQTAFIAEVPAMGYCTYRVFAEKTGTETAENQLTVREHSLENSRIRVDFDPDTGDICGFFDKEAARYIIQRPCRAVLLDETDCDTWAHDQDVLGEQVGAFCGAVFSVIESGLVRAVLRTVTKYGNSTLQRDFTLTPDSRVLQVKTRVDFHELHKALKFTFPMTDETVTAKIPYGTVTRKGYTGEEPCGSWIASGPLCVANDSKHGYDTAEGEMRLSVLRSAIFADHYGQPFRDASCEYMEQGVHEFTYAVFPYETNASAERTASELNFTPHWVVGSFHTGPLPEEMCGLGCDCENLVITAIKQAEDGKDTVIRLYEAEGKETHAQIELFGRRLSPVLSPNELKTFLGENEVNLLEWEKNTDDRL